ncbi:hypothetical protein QYE76_069855 [Lolium multiflorum]|uniref:F-box associated beta-propeller type 3 domain-containing protein n=1 Tax=Lolium multiflorum TaxID=4521 RepID=A0AAD8SJK0_LOLMU|nr:hypothetical protein QYE76_069855 [Lolium multiflorum]
MSSLPAATKAKAATAGLTPLHGGLPVPDEIAIWEILVRLPPKAVVRCRATSTRDFLLAHHAGQPTLPLLRGYNICGDGSERGSQDIIPFDHQAGVAAAADQQLLSVGRLSNAIFFLRASCDGLLVISGYKSNLSICNPVTRQYAPIQQLDGLGFNLLGMYRHSPTHEFRLLLYPAAWYLYDDQLPYDVQNGLGSYVFTLGSGQPPRHIGLQDVKELIWIHVSFLFRGNLYWHLWRDNSPSDMIMVFDTTSESFRKMRAPAVPGVANLFEMGDMLSMCSYNGATAIDIWVMEDYERETWTFKYRVELPVADIKVRFADFDSRFWVVAASWDDGLHVLLKSREWLFHVDVNGKLVASFHRTGLFPTYLWLKQTLVSHTFFPAINGHDMNASPFI